MNSPDVTFRLTHYDVGHHGKRHWNGEEEGNMCAKENIYCKCHRLHRLSSCFLFSTFTGISTRKEREENRELVSKQKLKAKGPLKSFTGGIEDRVKDIRNIQHASGKRDTRIPGWVFRWCNCCLPVSHVHSRDQLVAGKQNSCSRFEKALIS